MPIKKGFTLIELLVTITIVAILLLGSLAYLTQQRLKAEDVSIKNYLNRLKIAFEEYYNDKGCFPPPTWFDDHSDCGSSNLSPYLDNLQCDKKTGLPYIYETDNSACPSWFKLYATFSLPNFDKEAVATRSPTGSKKGNYGVSSTNVVVSTYYDGPIAQSPSPTSLPAGHEYYWCTSINNCTSNPDPTQICSPLFVDDANCGGTNDSKCPASDIGSCIPL